MLNFDTIKKNLFNSVRDFCTPEGAHPQATDRATGALLGIADPFPGGVAVLRQGPEAIQALFPGATVVAGTPDAFCVEGDLVAVRVWTAHNGGHSAGSPVFVHMDGNAIWGYVAARPNRVGSAPANAEVTVLNKDTLGVDGSRQYPHQEIRFKFGRFAGYREALTALYGWLLAGNGHRKDVVLVAQLAAEAHEEKNKAGVAQGRIIQPIGGWYLLEVPRVNTKPEGKVGALPLGNSRIVLQAVTSAATKQPTFTPAADASAQANQASADEI